MHINTASLISATDNTHTHTRVPISKRQRNSKQIHSDFSENETLNGEVGYVCTKKVLGFAEEQINDLTRDARPLIRELGATFQVLTPYLTQSACARAYKPLRRGLYYLCKGERRNKGKQVHNIRYNLN